MLVDETSRCPPRSSGQFRELIESEDKLLAADNSDGFDLALLEWSVKYGDLLLFEAAVGCVLRGRGVKPAAPPEGNGKPKIRATKKKVRDERGIPACCENR